MPIRLTWMEPHFGGCYSTTCKRHLQRKMVAKTGCMVANGIWCDMHLTIDTNSELHRGISENITTMGHANQLWLWCSKKYEAFNHLSVV